MRILIIGATGGTGRELVQQGLERGHGVTALARHPERVGEVAPGLRGRLTVLPGDVMDPASLAAAMRGQDAVVCALGHKRWLGPTRILSEGTRNVVHAMRDAAIKRLVVETALGVGDSAGRLGLYYTLFVVPFILPFYWYDKGRQERVVRESGLDWVIVRPGQLTNGPRRGTYRHGSNVGNFLWSVSISRADTADFMLNQIGETRYLMTAVGVCY